MHIVLEAMVTLALAPLYHQVTASPVLHQRYAPGRLGAVASEESVCSEIGTDLLRAGGNAADAMVGTVFCVGVIASYHCGIGGGGFMLVRAPNGTYEFIDFRETAPAAAFQDMYNNDIDLSIYGGLASGVPGEIRGLQHLHENYGQLSWKTVMQGAINTARNGFEINEDWVAYVKYSNTTVRTPSFWVTDPNWAIDFAPNGTLLGLGDTMTRRRLANTLETIAEEGPDAYYTGSIAEYTIKALQAANGTMTMDDLKNYRVAIRPVNNVTYRNFTLYASGAPSGGIVTLSAMNILSGYDDLFKDGNTNISTHRLDEALRFAYGQRTALGDPSFDANVTAYEQAMLSPALGADIRSRISNFHTLNVSAYNPEGFEELSTPGTSHFVTADGSGLAISLTTTINLEFGSNLMVPETGVIMNDEMNDFSIPGSSNAFGYIPSPSNFIVPRKRPQSSISPVIVEFANGTLYFLTGCAGGSRIISATTQNLVHVLDQGMTAPEAMAEPRFHDQLTPNQTAFEWAYNNETTAYMATLGYNVTWWMPGNTEAQAIRRLPNGTFEAAAEPRQTNSGGYAV